MGRDDLSKLMAVPRLAFYLDEIDKSFERVASDSLFSGAVSNIVKRPAKRLRPMLLIAGAQLAGKPIDINVLSAATAVELIHQASLVHDDIIDNDGQLEPAYALLLGDYLLSAGLAQAAQSSTEAADILSETIKSMAEGQAMQLTDRYRADTSDKYYIGVVKKKTAAIFQSACQLGALNTAFEKPLSQYGQAFGIAFQIIDDIADQDFETKKLNQAKRQADKYCSLAANALDGFPASPIKTSLQRIPQVFLEVSLP